MSHILNAHEISSQIAIVEWSNRLPTMSLGRQILAIELYFVKTDNQLKTYNFLQLSV